MAVYQVALHAVDGAAPRSGPLVQRCGGTPCSPPDREDMLQRRAARPLHTGGIPASVRHTLAAPGRPLEPVVRQRMQDRFGADFSSVRVHTDADAAASAHDVGAHAYTVGEHVVFAQNRYRPEAPGGTRTLAHELTHVLQQRSAGTLAQPTGISDPLDAAERQADAVADAVSRGRSAPVGPGAGLVLPGPSLHRAVETACLAPSELPSVNPTDAADLGRIFEVPIWMHYCATTGCAILATDYIDTDAASYIAFLAARNPHLTQADIVQLAIAALVTGGLFRPDILTHKPTRKEFEEIKPDSITGRAAGRAKLLGLATLYARFALPYTPGITWSGAGELTLVTLPGPVRVFLRWHRHAPGLVVYNLCVEGEAAVLAAYGIVAIMLAVIAIILSRGTVLGRLPIPALAASARPGPAGAPEATGALAGVGGDAVMPA